MPYLGRTVVTNLADFHVDNYASGGGFTAGSTTQLTLTVAGIDDEEALSIFFDGVHQHHNTYTIASSVVTFDTAIPTGTANVEIHYGKQPVASALAANSIDSEHYVDGSIDLAHMSSQSVDEDNLHISNSGSNGQFLSKQSGDAGGLTWATAGGGKVLQVVQTTKTDTTSTTSTSAVDISGMTVSITPASSSNKVYVYFDWQGSADQSSGQNYHIHLLRDSTDLLRGDAASSRTRCTVQGAESDGNGSSVHKSMGYLDSPSSTSSLAYKLQWEVQSNTLYLNREYDDANDANAARFVSSITVMEIEG